MATTRTKRLESYRIVNTSIVIKLFPFTGSLRKSVQKKTRLPAGDTVILRPPDDSELSYVARIEYIEQDSARRITLRVRWYYRPEEARGGRKRFHGSKELFLSDHFDDCSPETVENKCTVHTFDVYSSLQGVGTNDYFSRFDYNSSTGMFTPDTDYVYCTCELPYNPDNLMVQCETCEDWFHPPCIGLTSAEVRNTPHFHCPGCVNRLRQ